MRVAVVCVVLSLSALVYTQVPQHCAAPPIWNARFVQTSSQLQFFDRGEIFYDATNLRTAVFVEVDSSGQRERFYDLSLYKEETRYVLDRDTRECRVEKLSDPFRPIHIPLNATFIDTYDLGVADGEPGHWVQVDEWVGNTTDPDGEYTIMVIVPTCLPLNDVFFDREKGFVIQTFFYDINIGEDPNVFIPPPECL